MVHYKKGLAAFLLTFGFVSLIPASLASAHAGSLLKRGGTDWYYEQSKISIEVSIGALGTEGMDDARPVLTLTPRFELGQWRRSSFDLTLPLIIAGEGQGLGWTDQENPEGPLSRDLELGSTLILAPSVEWTSCRRTCFRPSLFFGAGLRYDRGSSVLLEDLGTFETEGSTSPVVTGGMAWNVPVVSPKLTLRLEARFLTTFYDSIQVRGPGAGLLKVEGGELTSAMLSFGFRKRF